MKRWETQKNITKSSYIKAAMDQEPPQTLAIKAEWLLPRKVYNDTEVKVLKKYSKLIRTKKLEESI